MLTINRTALVVKPGRPFLDWLQQVDPTSAGLTLETLQDDPTVYLIPECDSEQDVRKQLERVCGQIFEQQLDDWYRAPESWPRRRGLATFERWFEWTIHSMVVDLSARPVVRTEM